MRSILLSFCILAIFASLAFGQCCGGNKCATADKKGGMCCGGKMAAAVSYTDARMMPDCAPPPMHDFHRVLMPFIEARNNREPSYIRDNANYLFAASRGVPSSKACRAMFDKKSFKRDAKDLVKDCQRLQELSGNKAMKDDAVLSQLKLVEDDFVKLSNLCE